MEQDAQSSPLSNVELSNWLKPENDQIADPGFRNSNKYG